MWKAIFLGEGKFNWEPLHSVFFSIFNIAKKNIAWGQKSMEFVGGMGDSAIFSG